MCVQIYMHYPFERKVESSIKKSVFEGRSFGAKMTVEELIAKQTRIERSAHFLPCHGILMPLALPPCPIIQCVSLCLVVLALV